MLGFTVNDMFIKSLDGDLPVSQVMAIRGSLLLVLIIVIAWQQKVLSRIKELFIPSVAFRSIGEASATLLFLTALTQLPFASISAILQSLPLAVAMGAAIFLGEPVGWRRWIAIAIGFIGVLIIIRPGASGFESASLLVVASVVFAAARDVITRKLPQSLPSLLVSGATSLTLAVLGSLICLYHGDWHPVSGKQFATLAVAAFFLFFGYQFIVLAMRTGEVAYVVPYRYTSLLWAIIFGYFIFNEVPDFLTLLGSAIVVATGLFTLYREIATGRRAVVSTSAQSQGNVWHEQNLKKGD
jgi:drug/metabolite transporter (DMT)-like permease